MTEKKYKLIKHIATLSDPDKFCVKQANLIDWGYGIKLDIRTWKQYKTGNYPTGQGYALDVNNFLKLKEAIKNITKEDFINED